MLFTLIIFFFVYLTINCLSAGCFEFSIKWWFFCVLTYLSSFFDLLGICDEFHFFFLESYAQFETQTHPCSERFFFWKLNFNIDFQTWEKKTNSFVFDFFLIILYFVVNHISFAVSNICFLMNFSREYLYDAYSERDNIPLAK